MLSVEEVLQNDQREKGKGGLVVSGLRGRDGVRKRRQKEEDKNLLF